MSDAVTGGGAPAAPAPQPNQAPVNTAQALFSAFESSFNTEQGEGIGGDDNVVDHLLGGGDQPDEAQPQDGPVKHTFDEAALEGIVEVKANGEVKEMPLKEALRLASLAEGAQQRLAQAAEERKKIVQEREELEATQTEIGEVMRDPARFFSEMLMSDVDAVGYVTRMVQIAQSWLGKSEAERALMLREEKWMEREQAEKRALEQRTKQAESAAIAKVLTKAEVPDYLQDFVRARVERVVDQYRGKRQLTVTELAEFARKQYADIEAKARGRMSDEQRKAQVRPEDLAAAAKAKVAEAKPMVQSAPVQRDPRTGQFQGQQADKPLTIDPFNPRSIRNLVR